MMTASSGNVAPSDENWCTPRDTLSTMYSDVEGRRTAPLVSQGVPYTTADGYRFASVDERVQAGPHVDKATICICPGEAASVRASTPSYSSSIIRYSTESSISDGLVDPRTR